MTHHKIHVEGIQCHALSFTTFCWSVNKSYGNLSVVILVYCTFWLAVFIVLGLDYVNSYIL